MKNVSRPHQYLVPLLIYPLYVSVLVSMRSCMIRLCYWQNVPRRMEWMLPWVFGSTCVISSHYFAPLFRKEKRALISCVIGLNCINTIKLIVIFVTEDVYSIIFILFLSELHTPHHLHSHYNFSWPMHPN